MTEGDALADQGAGDLFLQRGLGGSAETRDGRIVGGDGFFAAIDAIEDQALADYGAGDFFAQRKFGGCAETFDDFVVGFEFFVDAIERGESARLCWRELRRRLCATARSRRCRAAPRRC